MSHNSPEVLILMCPTDESREFSYLTFFNYKTKEGFRYTRGLRTSWVKENPEKVLEFEGLQGKPFHLVESPWYGKSESSSPQKEKTSKVYFVQSVVGGPIKIGQSFYPESRLKELQTGSPFELRLIATTSEYLESELHSRFAHARLHGEWFEPVPELLNLIESINGGVYVA